MKNGTHIQNIEKAINNGDTTRMVNLLKTNRDTISLIERLSLAQQCLANADLGGVLHLVQNQIVATAQIASKMDKNQAIDMLYAYKDSAVDYFVNDIVLGAETEDEKFIAPKIEETEEINRPLKKSHS